MPDEKSLANLKPFKPGQTGNAGGRPKGLEKRTREIVGDDIDGITYVQRCVAFGVAPDPDHLVRMGVELSAEQREQMKQTFATIKVKDANEATKNLEDRGWGKAKQTVKINENTGRSVPKQMPTMSRDALRALAQIDEAFAGIPDDELDGLEPDGATQH